MNTFTKLFVAFALFFIIGSGVGIGVGKALPVPSAPLSLGAGKDGVTSEQAKSVQEFVLSNTDNNITNLVIDNGTNFPIKIIEIELDGPNPDLCNTPVHARILLYMDARDNSIFNAVVESLITKDGTDVTQLDQATYNKYCGATNG